MRISPRAGPLLYLRPGKQRITSFRSSRARTAAARVLARAQKDTIEDVQRKARAALAALDVEAAKQQMIALLQIAWLQSGASGQRARTVTMGRRLQIGLQQMPADSQGMHCMPK